MNLREILTMHPREEWVSLIKEYNLIEEEFEGFCSMIGAPLVQFNIKDLEVLEFPFKDKDIVTIKNKPGRYVIYDYPWLDKRLDNKENLDIYEPITQYGNVYWLIGLDENGFIAGTEDCRDENSFILPNDCRSDNLESLNESLEDYPEDHILWSLYKQYKM